MFDKFAMADKKKEALERQVCHLEWPDNCHKNSITPVEAGCNEPYRPVELRRGGQHQHRPQQYQGIKRLEEETCCNKFYRLVEIYKWAWTSMKLSRRTSRFQPLLLKANCVFILLWYSNLQFDTNTGDRGKWRWLGGELKTFPQSMWTRPVFCGHFFLINTNIVHPTEECGFVFLNVWIKTLSSLTSFYIFPQCTT